MKSRWEYVTLEEALRRVMAFTTVIEESELVEIENAYGRVMAEDVLAVEDVPPWDRAAVDGYALRAADTLINGAATLSVVGEVAAGDHFQGKVRKGECVKVATGAPVPSGTDAVVMTEETLREGDKLTVKRKLKRGENVSHRGVDIRRGRRVASAHDFIGVGLLGALASQGIGYVKVIRRPCVAVIPGGNEIVRPGSKREAFQIYDVNSYTVGAIVSASGGRAVLMPGTSDTRASVLKALDDAMECDIIVFTSGSSKGDPDLVEGVIRERGKLLFHGVRIRPGRPSMAGKVDDRLVFGLPGYPVSAVVGARLLLRPCIKKMLGLKKGERVERRQMAESIEGDDAFDRIVTVKISNGDAVPAFRESGAITSVSRADGFTVVRRGRKLRKGALVEISFFE